tara:strand:+ start:411 stop:683 length:273 start_codon:yes stop_codon:yes gene_type:complete
MIMFNKDITAAKPLPDRQLQLVFEDGLQATIHLDKIIKHYTGVFAPLLEDAFFQQVQVAEELGTIVWPNGADVCPDVLYAAASGKSLPAS